MTVVRIISPNPPANVIINAQTPSNVKIINGLAQNGGGGSVDSVNGVLPDVNKNVILIPSDIGAEVAGAAAAALISANQYADNLVIGLWDDRGNLDASVNTFPAAGGSGTAGAILKGDIWTVSVGGTLGGNIVTAGDTVRALVDTPGQTSANWAIAENNTGYVPENVINKDTDPTFAADSDTKYPSQKAVKTALTKPATEIIIGTGSGIGSSNEFTYSSATKVFKVGSQASKGDAYGVQLLPYSGAANPIVTGIGSLANSNAIWLNQATPSFSNYAFLATIFTTVINATSNVSLYNNNTIVADFNASVASFTPRAATTGANTQFLFRAAANTTQTAGAETIAFHADFGTNTVQHASNTAIATNRDFLITARTHRFASATGTITDAGTLVITGAPIAGTNCLIPNPYAVWVQSGTSYFNGSIKITDGTQGAGKVLTSDANGLASWQTPSGGGGGGTPSAPANSVQFNNAGAFGGSSTFISNGTNTSFGYALLDTTGVVRVDSTVNGVVALKGFSYGSGASTNYGLYYFAVGSSNANYGLYAAAVISPGDDPASLLNIGGSFEASGATENYALKLADPSTASGRHLKCVSGLGYASWSDILTLAVTANAAPTDGDIWREDNTNTGLKVRINGVTKTITVS